VLRSEKFTRSHPISIHFFGKGAIAVEARDHAKRRQQSEEMSVVVQLDKDLSR
jgi:hypothetical protein